MWLTLIFLVTLLLAAANGANDNIKGAATLVGSGVDNHGRAIRLATLATAAGGIASIFLANGLIAAFSGSGIVPPQTAGSIPFLLAVGTSAAVTVWLATTIGMPVSTTHALLGGLLGAGSAMTFGRVAVGAAFKAMVLPLLASPLMALALALAVVPLVRRLRDGPENRDVSIGHDVKASDGDHGLATDRTSPAVTGVEAPEPPRRWFNRTHALSAAAVSFARGLNDTPKIAALAVAGSGWGVGVASIGVVSAMAIGGLLASRRVSDTLAHKVARMDAGEGLGGNLVTASLVIGASRFGLPVSTTHVSTGALFGVAATNRSGRSAMIRHILLAWCLTLPVAGAIAFFAGLILHLAR
ncbi:MAG: inorganic phosphate transporter [Proteobacteria bacterium]|nr:inorganic phosphate transporter [Pseudomonadota bacterium]